MNFKMNTTLGIAFALTVFGLPTFAWVTVAAHRGRRAQHGPEKAERRYHRHSQYPGRQPRAMTDEEWLDSEVTVEFAPGWPRSSARTSPGRKKKGV